MYKRKKRNMRVNINYISHVPKSTNIKIQCVFNRQIYNVKK